MSNCENIVVSVKAKNDIIICNQQTQDAEAMPA